MTQDERYAEAAARYVEEWIDANPRGEGINWASSLEVSLRLISWCWAYSLMRGARSWSGEFLGVIRGEIASHASHVERYLSHHFSPNTHLTGEALGLLYAGVLLSRRHEAGGWLRRAAGILVQQSARQMLADGVYFERTTWYQRYTIEIYLHFLILASRSGIAVPFDVGDRVQRSLDFLLAVLNPEGRLPQIGDADGGFLLPLARRDADDLRGVFSTAAVLFRRQDYAWAASEPAPETLWLLGPAGLEDFRKLRLSPPTAPPSRIFSLGGYAVMSSAWTDDAHKLILDAGPIGCPMTAGHGHADLLSIQCCAFGKPYIVDPGTYTYTAEPEWRDHFRSTAAHSTVQIDGEGQAEPAGIFSWKTRPEARIRRWFSNADVDYADAAHDAYQTPGGAVVHRRRVLFVKPAYWIVVDDLEGAGEHRIDLRFQLAPMAVEIERDHWVRARGPEGHALLIRVFSIARLKAEILEGSLQPVGGWISTEFGRRRPAPLLSYAATARLPVRIATVLYPVNDPGASTPCAYPVIVDGPKLAGLVLGEAPDLIGIDEDAVTFRRD